MRPGARGMQQRQATCQACSFSRSTGSPTTCSSRRCATAAHRRWRAGSATARTGRSRVGIRVNSPRPGRCSRGSCQARTGTCLVSAGGRKVRGGRWSRTAPRRGRDREATHKRQGPSTQEERAERTWLGRHAALDDHDEHAPREARGPGRPGSYFRRSLPTLTTSPAPVLVVKEIVAELWQQTQQKRQGVEPASTGAGPPTRSCARTRTCCSASWRSAATIQDLPSGRPVIYSMFLGYDEVAHHSGIERPRP